MSIKRRFITFLNLCMNLIFRSHVKEEKEEKEEKADRLVKKKSISPAIRRSYLLLRKIRGKCN